MLFKQPVVGILGAAAFVVVGLFMPSFSVAQDQKVKTAMELLKSGEDKLGPPKIEGMDTVAEKRRRHLFWLYQNEQQFFPC